MDTPIGTMAVASKEVDMEYVFARDIINVLVRRKVKDFQLEDTHHDLPTPFCFRIRRAVEHYATNEDVNIYYVVTDLRAFIPDFKAMISFQRDDVLPKVSSLVGFLKHVTVLCMMAAWHCKWGEPTAPAEAVEEIRRMLIDLVSKYEDPDTFWTRLRTSAPFITERPLNESEREFKSKLDLE